MEFSRIGDDVLLRLDPGEEIHQSIQSLSKHGIDCAVITSQTLFGKVAEKLFPKRIGRGF